MILSPPLGKQLNFGHRSTKGLILCPEFNGKGSMLPDLTLGRNHGTISGATWVGQGLQFDGDNDFVDCGAGVKPSSFTVSALVKWDAATQMNWIGWSSGSDYPNLFLNWNDTSQPLMYLGSSAFRWFHADAYTVIVDGDWHFVTFTCENNIVETGKMYVDGVEYAVTSTNTGTGDAKGNLFIATANSSFSSGNMTNVSIYDRVLTVGQIKELCRNPNLPFQQYELALWAAMGGEGAPPSGMAGIYYRTLLQGAA